MKLKHFVVIAIGFIVGWNISLIQRDSNLIKHYDHPKLEELK
jgi:hypothetical protein